MALTPQQKTDIYRLRDNETLTGNLTDAAATAVLEWAEGQIAAGVAYDTVVAGVRAANGAETEDPAVALAAANQSLAAAAPPRTTAAVAQPAPPQSRPASPRTPVSKPPNKSAKARASAKPSTVPLPAAPRTDLEDKLPLLTPHESPEDAEKHDALETAVKLPLPISHEGPDDAGDDDTSEVRT